MKCVFKIVSKLFSAAPLCGPQSEDLLTLHYMREDALVINTNMEFLTKQGTLIAVVHQYDRHPALTKAAEKRFCGIP